MTKQIFFRIAIIISFFLAATNTDEAAMVSVPMVQNIPTNYPSANHESKDTPAHDTYANYTNQLAKGHYLQLVVEETVHFHDFCFDKIRRRQRVISFLFCCFTKLFLVAIHLTIIACHLDHLLNHGLHYLLGYLMSA